MKKSMKIIAALLLGAVVLSGCSRNEPSQEIISSDHSRPIQSETNSEESNSLKNNSLESSFSSENSVPVVSLPSSEASDSSSENVSSSTTSSEVNPIETSSSEKDAPVLLYMGQASIRVVTPENKVIYIDPYAGDDGQYSLPADLVLVTHAHFDHSMVDKVMNRAEDCQIITHNEAVQNGEHKIFEFDYVTVEAVEAGYNSLHDVRKCVGYVLTFTNRKSIYVTGDTSKTEQMPLLAEKHIDYAFFCCDGVYNMGFEEAAECVELVKAAHNIPYHNTTTTTGRQFSRELAEQFNAPNRLIVEDGEEILIN